MHGPSICYICITEHIVLNNKKNKLKQEITWMHIKYIMLSEGNQNQKATCSVIPLMWHSSKGKTQGQNRDQWLRGAEVTGVDGCYKWVNMNLLILTCQGKYHDHKGSFPRARFINCTLDALTPAISPNVGNSNAKFVVVGDCVRSVPWKKKKNLLRWWIIPCLYGCVYTTVFIGPNS